MEKYIAEKEIACPDCGKSNQSPIDLKSSITAYSTYKALDDNFMKTYLNVSNVKVEWKDKSTKVALGQGYF